MKNKIKELVEMLTVVRYFVPNLKDIHYSIMVEYCVAQSKYYCMIDEPVKALYWTKLSTKYLLKRLDVLHKRGVL